MVDRNASSINKLYSKEELTKQIAQVASFLKKHELNSEITVRSIYEADGDNRFGKTKVVSSEVQLPLKDKGRMSELIKELKKEDLDKIIKIKCCVVAGDDFPEIPDVDRPLQEEGLSLTHTPGTVLLVDFWATWCVPCQEPMAHNQEMLVKNQEKWKDKVKIVGFSLDENVIQLSNRLKQTGWDKVDHYILPGGFKHEGSQILGCTGVPFIVLVNKQGKIVYTGKPNLPNIEEEIDALLAAPETEGTKIIEGPKEDEIPDKDFRLLRSLIKDGNFKLPRQLPESEINSKTPLEQLCIEIKCTLSHLTKYDINMKKISVRRQKLLVRGEMSTAAAAKLKQMLSDCTKGISEDTVTVKIKETNPEQGSKCIVF